MKNGGKLLIQHKVTDIKPDGPIVTVVTEGGDSFQAKKVIVTAGPWTKDLMQITGLELPLKVRKFFLSRHRNFRPVQRSSFTAEFMSSW